MLVAQRVGYKLGHQLVVPRAQASSYGRNGLELSLVD